MADVRDKNAGTAVIRGQAEWWESTENLSALVDRIDQTAVRFCWKRSLSQIFHPDSYGYRPGRSAHDALAVTRQRGWKQDWAIDLDVRVAAALSYRLVE
jgi:hypothetical protein